MPCHNVIAVQIACASQQTAEFDVFVADNAGIRRLAAQISVGKTPHNLTVKFPAHIENMMLYSQTFADALCVADVMIVLVAEQPHGRADCPVSLMDCKQCRHRAVHSAAHRYHSFFHSLT